MSALRCLVPAMLIAACSGCFNPKVEKKEKTDEKKGGGGGGTLANQLLPGDLDNLAKPRRPGNGQPPKPPKVHEHRVAGSQGTAGMMTNRVFNFHEIIKKRPDLNVMSKSTTGSFVTNTYYSAASRASVLTFKHNMDIWRAANGRYPSYKEYISQTKKHKLVMAKLPRWQVWAYDDRTGSLKVLEDPKLKAKIEGN